MITSKDVLPRSTRLVGTSPKSWRHSGDVKMALPAGKNASTRIPFVNFHQMRDFHREIFK